jgi:adenylate cyclase class 2
MFEIELKAVLTPVLRTAVLGALRRFPDVRAARFTTRDVYYDLAGGLFRRAERELRLRQRDAGDDAAAGSALLTWKGEPLDPASKSKEEIEVGVGDGAAMQAILGGLGFEPDVVVAKGCHDFRFHYREREIAATVADLALPGLGDTSFLEVEILVGDAAGAGQARAVLADLLAELAVPGAALTAEYYTDMVRSRGD